MQYQISGEDLKNIIYEMADVAGLDSDFAEQFINEISDDGSLVNEFIIYIAEKRFTCENKVRGYSVVDIMVWQMDHFKAFLDRGLDGMKNNECEMVLKAFDTFMKMKKAPDRYVEMLTGETGSDFEGKSY